MTVSLSGMVKYLCCDETLAFLAESKPIGLFTRCLLSCYKTVVLVVVVVLWL